LAPSPIAKVIHGPFLFASPTTSAFYFGETLQQITDAAFMPSSKNSLDIEISENANDNVGPSITMAILCFNSTS
jgi:hypothetical protein